MREETMNRMTRVTQIYCALLIKYERTIQDDYDRFIKSAINIACDIEDAVLEDEKRRMMEVRDTI